MGCSSKVSVIMPAYNCEQFIAEAIDSVLQQTYTNIELIVIDDCSTDNTFSIIEQYAVCDPRVRTLRNSANCGVAKTRNCGLDMAEGDYVAFLDSDDIWDIDKLRKQMELALKANADIVYSSYGFIDEDGNEIKKAFIVPEETNFRKMLIQNVISASSAVIRASIMKDHRFRNDVYHEDYALWMELMSERARAVGCKDVLWRYRQRKGGRNRNKLHAAKERWKIYRCVLHLNIFTSAWSMCGYAICGVVKYYLGSHE